MGRSIYSHDGKRLLLVKGTVLDNIYVQRLLSMGYQSVYALDDLTEDIEPQELISPIVRTQANSTVFEFHEKVELLNNLRKFEQLRQIANDIIYEVLGLDLKETTIDFPEIKSFDNYLYLHSVNVAVLGTIICYKLRLHEEVMLDYALGAMLHDIGKVETPAEILHKPGPLSEDEFDVIKKHSRDGFALLSQSSFMKPRSFSIALQHHEAYDGSGYPAGKKGEEIHQFSRIASVVDIFDALTTDRPYKKRWSFHKTLNLMKNRISKRLDPEVMEVLLSLVPEFPAGLVVKLSTGESGIIISANPNMRLDPKVRIIEDAKGNKLNKEWVYEINLGEFKEIRIVSTSEDSAEEIAKRRKEAEN